MQTSAFGAPTLWEGQDRAPPGFAWDLMRQQRAFTRDVRQRMSRTMREQTASNNPPKALQRVVKVRRDYNTWVANETMEDYALRFTPRSYRKWTESRVANTAFGAAAFLVLEAVGATLLVNYGFVNAALAILATGLIIFLVGLPVSIYAARHGLD